MATGEILHDGRSKAKGFKAELGETYGLYYTRENGFLVLYKLKAVTIQPNQHAIDYEFIGILFSGLESHQLSRSDERLNTYAAVSVKNEGDVVSMKGMPYPDALARSREQYYENIATLSLSRSKIVDKSAEDSQDDSSENFTSRPPLKVGCTIA